MAAKKGQIVVLYGVPIIDAVGRGDLKQMKTLAAQAEKQLAEMGDLHASLAMLKAEIAKIEYAAKKK